MATGERHDTCLHSADERSTPRYHEDDVCWVAGRGHGFRRDGSPAGEIGRASG